LHQIDKLECEANHLVSEYVENVKVFKAFCDENRLRILQLLRTAIGSVIGTHAVAVAFFKKH